MPALRIFAFARTSRWAIVASGTRNARAMSVVVRPPSERSVSATWASVESAGWQQAKISASRSSGSSLISSASSAASSDSPASSSDLWARVRSRRIRSMARLRAVVTIQPPGLGGTPVRGQRSSAVSKASWSASSARARSPVARASAATARPHSSRKICATSSMALLARGGARRHLGHRADLDRAAVCHGRDLAGPVECLVERLHVDLVVAAEPLLRLGERAIAREQVPALDAHGRRRRERLEPVASDHRAGLDQLLAVAGERRAHPLALLLGAGARLTLDVDQQHVLHETSSG